MQQEQKRAWSRFRLQKKPNLSRWLPGLIGASFVVVIGLGFFYRQPLIDNYTVWSYQPSTEISKISSEAQFSSLGQFYFYASLPEINNASNFNQKCVRQEATSVILGCYSAQRIYIYDVKNNQKLSGVKTVTAAHEMLHAVWERLASSDKEWLSVRLQQAYERLKTDELVERMKYYEDTEPGEEMQELHSILGTEFSNLGSELETYYAKYFTNRQALVDVYKEYSNVINSINEQMIALSTEIATLTNELNGDIIDYNTQATSINSEVVALENSRSSVDTTNYNAVMSFNNKRSSLVSKIQVLNSKRQAILDKQETYLSRIKQYNDLVLTGSEIRSSLDSALQEAPNVTE